MSDPNPQPENALVAKRFKIPGDLVNRKTADLDDEKRSLIRWLHAEGAERDYSLQELGDKIRYDPATVWKVFNGKYEGNLDNVCKAIADYKAIIELRSKGKSLGYTHTKLDDRIWKVCDLALEFQRIAFIIGETQIGKTMALIRYAMEHNHGSTIYIRMPVNPCMSQVLESMAVALRISPQQRERDLRRRVISAFDDRMLLIVDEIHQCLYTKHDAAASRPIEFIRELYDSSQCGVVICGTPVFDEAMERGRFSGILKQTKRRRGCKLVLPSVPRVEDLNTFAARSGLGPTPGRLR
ncbi:MAG TPA: hypothetical protein DCZ69_02670, partial [Syntrophobacteraceae bacterium]|nr:hypothetical protein [Syntrophobacteraceae bacterium]